jgi:hypothetical protein
MYLMFILWILLNNSANFCFFCYNSPHISIYEIVMATPIPTQQSEELKDIVIKYLQGQSIRTVKIRLSEVSEACDRGGKDLFKSLPINPSLANDKFIVAILGSLNIKRSEMDSSQYEKLISKSQNVHELLTLLYHDGYHHVGYLLTLIEKTKPPRNWANIFILGTLLSGGLGIFAYFKNEYIDAAIAWATETFPNVINWLGRTFSLLRNVPLLGIINTSLNLTWVWYSTFSNGTTTTQYKLQNLLFKTLTAGFAIGAYYLTFLAGGVLPFLAAVLFVLGSSIDVIKGVYNYFQTQNELLSLLPVLDNEHSWEELAELERAKNLRYRSLQSVWVKLAAAILTTIAVIVWNFSPPNLILTVSCMVVMTLISMTKRTLLSGIQENYAHRLQKNIRDLNAYPSPELTPSSSHSIFRLKQKEEKLRLKEIELNEHELELNALSEKISIRSQAVEDTLSALAKSQNLSSLAKAMKILSPDKVLHPINEEESTDHPDDHSDDHPDDHSDDHSDVHSETVRDHDRERGAHSRALSAPLFLSKARKELIFVSENDDAPHRKLDFEAEEAPANGLADEESLNDATSENFVTPRRPHGPPRYGTM